MARHGESKVLPMVLLVFLLAGEAVAQPGGPVILWETVVSNLSKRNLTLEICDQAAPGCAATTFLRVDPLSFHEIGQGYPTQPIELRITDVKTGKKLEKKLEPDQLDPFQTSGSVIYVLPSSCGRLQLEVWLGNDKFGNTRLGNIVI